MFRLSYRRSIALGLLLNSIALLFWVLRPASLHTDVADGGMGFLMGIGIGLMLMALIKKRRAG